MSYQVPISDAKAAGTIDPAAEIVKMLLDHGADPNEKTIVSAWLQLYISPYIWLEVIIMIG